jgi:carbonic anhydrase/acetyltransferase-like protein (isoleucine patch superfamily)
MLVSITDCTTANGGVMKQKRIAKTVLVQGMTVKARVMVEHESGLVMRDRVAKVIRIEARSAEFAGKVVTQYIAILGDRFGKTHEFDLTHPLWVKNKKKKWVRRRGV